MLVSQVLNKKSGKKALTVSPNETVEAAIDILATNRIGALVVSIDGKAVLGVLSERDIVRGLSAQGPKVLQLLVSDLMTSKVLDCRPTDTVEQIMQTMTNNRFRHMPVVDNGEMLGVISIGDVVKERMDEIAHEKDALVDMIKGF
jgi:CBS domain-containing protein